MKKEDSLKYEFMPSAVEIVEKPVSPLGSMTIWSLLLLVVITLVWCIFGKIDQVAVARGIAIPEDKVRYVKSVEEGKALEVLVKDGDKVEKGQLLVKLDPVLKNIDLESAKINLNKIIGEKIALESICNNKPIIIPDGVTLSGKDIENLNKYKEAEISSFNLQVDTTLIQKRKLDENMKKSKEDLKKLNEELSELVKEEKEALKELNSGGIIEASLKDLEEKISKLQQEYDFYKSLYEGKTLSESEWKVKDETLTREINPLKAQKSSFQLKYNEKNNKLKKINDSVKNKEESVKSTESTIKQLEDKFKELNNSIESINVQRDSQLLKLIMEKNKEIDSLKAQIERAEKSNEISEIRASTDGVINDLKDITEGSLVGAGQEIMSVVPSNEQVYIEANILNKDIGFINEEQEAEVKVDAFPSQKYGSLVGKVETIGANALVHEQLGMVFKTKISLEDNKLNIDGKILKIVPGMEVTVEISTGRKSVIEVIFEPIFSHLRDGLKVR